ncbi:hypothetical protein JD844_013498 [Phrynosoma platyrhinos]|uniref:Uncharacterized protein n=1 Tax=Phrynosoma platyrhinos TaxID=52577 RepID=A0ABQ7TLX7_PHRPL|nr:hypothetical protein JD844_013498 [Phrynosoma platyrhinos]
MNSVGYVVDVSPKLEERLRILSATFFDLGEAANICKEKLEEVLIIDFGEQTLNTGNFGGLKEKGIFLMGDST